jgi:hypothetical protein
LHFPISQRVLFYLYYYSVAVQIWIYHFAPGSPAKTRVE